MSYFSSIKEKETDPHNLQVLREIGEESPHNALQMAKARLDKIVKRPAKQDSKVYFDKNHFLISINLLNSGEDI